jgi:3-isopropylmalate/(R)-2-methylmalate dehydratase large subunit
MSKPRTIIEKIWDAHVVTQKPGAPALLYIDLHLVHDVTSPQAFEGLRTRGLRVRRPDLTIAVADHNIPTTDRSLPVADPVCARQIEQLDRNCAEFRVPCHGLNSPRQGVVHVMGPELGLTQPGMTVVCGDSHTATHGAFGALAFGIGTSEVLNVLATQCLLQNKPRTYQVVIEGSLKRGVTAKDVILALIAKIGTGGATGCVFEFSGSTVRALSMDERMTVCNMSIEAGARAGLMAPDEKTFAYLMDKPYAPKGAHWDAAVSRWKQLPSDEGAAYDVSLSLEASAIEPMVTYGTSPGMGMPISAPVPDPASAPTQADRDSLAKALRYMDLQPGKPLLGHPIQVVFIGSCTNGRINDLRDAARVLKGRKVKPGVRVLVVPGSQTVKCQAEAEGLDAIFRAAGAEWRESGCSMCLAMNGDQIQPGEYCVATSNRNFEGRQGPGGRTILASPLTAAASAVAGAVADVRTLL